MSSRARAASARTSQRPFSTSATTSASFTSPSSPPSASLPVDFRQSVVLSSSDFYHAHTLSSPFSPTLVNAEAISKRKLDLREQSRNRYMKWNNTLDAQREKKREHRLNRLAEIEKCQQLIDAEEQVYNEAERRNIVNRANLLLFSEKDAVKTLQTGVELVKIQAERKLQIQQKQQNQAQNKAKEVKQELEREMERQRLIAIEEQEQYERKRQSRVLARTQLAQLAQHRARQLADREEELKEGEKIKQISEEAAREAKKEEERRRERQQNFNSDYLRANQEQFELKEAAKLQEAELESRIARFAAEKEELENKRKEAESIRFESKQKQFNQMISRQFAHLQSIQANEAQRVEKQVAEMAEKYENLRQKQEETKQELKRNVQKSREQQVLREEEEKKEKKRVESLMSDEWKKRNEEMKQKDKWEQTLLKQTNKQLQAQLRQQMVEKDEQIRKQVEAEREEIWTLKEAAKREDQIFDFYAKTQLEILKQQGKNIVPAQLALQAIKSTNYRHR